jgi:hypothetical protein
MAGVKQMSLSEYIGLIIIAAAFLVLTLVALWLQ